MALAGPGEFAAQLRFSQHFVNFVKLMGYGQTGRKWDRDAKVWKFALGCYDQVGRLVWGGGGRGGGGVVEGGQV
jgi:hypothetical protein